MNVVLDDGELDVEQLPLYAAINVQDLTSDSGSDLPYGEAGRFAWIKSSGTNADQLDQIARIIYSSVLGVGNYSVTFPPEPQRAFISTGPASSFEYDPYEETFNDATGIGRKQQEEFIGLIKQAISYGDYSLALEEALSGLKEYPDNSILQNYSKVLSPPTIVERDLKPIMGLDLNIKWIKENGNRYSGMWIALCNGELLGASESLSSLLLEIGEKENILFTKAL